MQCILSFLNANEGALMVVITAVYVIATLFICVFNGKSAKATREQVAESKRQFEESKRLQMMPYLDCVRSRFEDIDNPLQCRIIVSPSEESGFYCTAKVDFEFTNIGNGSLKELELYRNLPQSVIERLLSLGFDCPSEQTKNINFPLSCLKSGEKAIIHFEFYCPKDENNQDTFFVQLKFKYKDMLENIYEQELKINLGYSKYTDDESSLFFHSFSILKPEQIISSKESTNV